MVNWKMKSLLTTHQVSSLSFSITYVHCVLSPLKANMGQWLEMLSMVDDVVSG